MDTNGRGLLRNLYLYGICLITLLIAIFAAVGVVRNTAELLYPDPAYYGYYDDERPAVEREREEQAAKDSQRRSAVLGLVGSGTTLLLAGPIYLYHWRRVQQEKPARSGQPAPAGPAPADRPGDGA